MQTEQGTCGKGSLGAHLCQQQQPPPLLLAHLPQRHDLSSSANISAKVQLLSVNCIKWALHTLDMHKQRLCARD